MARRLFFRLRPESLLTVPLLLDVWARSGLADECPASVWTDPAGGEPGPGDAVLYGFMTPHLPLVAGEITRLRRRYAPGMAPLLVAGGPHACGDPELTLAAGFDGVVAGPGERGLPDFGRRWLKGTLPPAPWTLPGGGGLAGFLPLSPLLDTLPPLEIMRGCPWRCRYCQTGGQAPEYRPRAEIEDYLDRLRARGARRVSFIAPSALEFGAAVPGHGDSAAIAWLLDAARRRDFRFVEYGIFPSEVRPDTVTAPLLELLKGRVSNRRLTLGAQSGSEARLRAAGRGHDLAAVERALDLAAAAGFGANLDFIFAYPGETFAELAESVATIRRWHRRYGIRAQCHHFFPLAGSAWARRFPAPLDPAGRELLDGLHRDGIATDWWREGEKTAARYFAWLRREHPAAYDRFS